jgi:hypothetical protein
LEPSRVMTSTDLTIWSVSMNELIDEINKKDSILEADILDSEVRILHWILYMVHSSKVKMSVS